MRFITTFDAEGNLLRAYSLTAIERLLAMKRIWVRRNRRGTILCAQFLPRPGEGRPLAATAYRGQHYSLEEHFGDRLVWQHKEMPEPGWIPYSQREAADVDRYIRAVFCAVPLSIGDQLPLAASEMGDA